MKSPDHPCDFFTGKELFYFFNKEANPRMRTAGKKDHSLASDDYQRLFIEGVSLVSGGDAAGGPYPGGYFCRYGGSPDAGGGKDCCVGLPDFFGYNEFRAEGSAFQDPPDAVFMVPMVMRDHYPGEAGRIKSGVRHIVA